MNRRIVTRAKRLAELAPGALLLLSFLGTAASPLGIWSSHLERMSHFRFGWIVLLILLVAYFIKRGQRRLGFNVIVYDGDKRDAALGENINKSRIAWSPRSGVQGRPEDWGRMDLE